MSSTPATPVPIRIDFGSDVSCPWCVIGLKSLEQALADRQTTAVALIQSLGGGWHTPQAQ